MQQSLDILHVFLPNVFDVNIKGQVGKRNELKRKTK